MNEEELKPCPYHGDPSSMEFASASNRYAACRKCDRGNETWYRPVEDWNNAYCWKEIDRLKAELQQMQNKMDSKWCDEVGVLTIKIAELESELQAKDAEIKFLNGQLKSQVFLMNSNAEKDAEIARLEKLLDGSAVGCVNGTGASWRVHYEAERSRSEKLEAEIAHLKSFHAEVAGRNVTLACENVELKNELKNVLERSEKLGEALKLALDYINDNTDADKEAEVALIYDCGNKALAAHRKGEGE